MMQNNNKGVCQHSKKIKKRDGVIKAKNKKQNTHERSI